MSDVAVVTGANSGIGRATAIHLAANGYEVYGTIRDRGRAAKLEAMAAERGAEVRLVELDVADDDSVRAGFEEIARQASGGVDLLVNNAGVGANAVIEATTAAELLEVMNVNLCGAVRCAQAVLPGMRERRRGTIVNVSSVVGRIGALAQAPYTVSKWALEGLSEELAIEVAPFGIRVVIVEPGITKSAIFAKNTDMPGGMDDYEPHYRRMMQMYAAGIPNATDPFEVGAVILEAARSASPRLRYHTSWGGAELVEGRARISDEDWVAIGAVEADDDEGYYERFEKAFGLDLRL
jgi:NAD(P)-dependent dehydrogenase (short-subunit alcohol dehydrogenase family)